MSNAACLASGQTRHTFQSSKFAGVIIEAVQPGSPAAKAKLSSGDVILCYGGRSITSPFAFGAAIENLCDQPKVTLTVRRGTRIFDVLVDSHNVSLDRRNFEWIFRPQLSAQMLPLYQAGLKPFLAKHWESSVALWISAFRAAEARGDTQTSAWLCSLVANNYRAIAIDDRRTPTQDSKDVIMKQALQWVQRLWLRIAREQDREARANTLMALGTFNLNLRKPLAALPWLQRAYPLAMACHDEMWMADCLEWQGLIALGQATPEFGGPNYYLTARLQIEQARKPIHDAFAIRKRLSPDSIKTAQSYGSLSLLARADANAKVAYEYATAACVLYRKFLPDSQEVAGCLNDRGDTAVGLQNLTQAQQDYEEAMSICRRKFPYSIILTTILYRRLAQVFTLRGNTRQANFYVQKTLHAWQKSVRPIPLETVELLNTRGLIAVLQGDLESAEKYNEEALLVVNKASPISAERVHILTTLGLVELARGNFKKSQKYCEEAYGFWQYAAPSSVQIAGILNCLGLVNESAGKSKIAEQNYEEARVIWQNRSPDSLGMAVSLTGLATIALSQGKVAAAEQFCTRALALTKKSAGPFAEAKGQTLMGEVMLRRRQHERALTCFKRATSLLEDQRQAIYSLESRAFLVQQNSDAFTGLMQTYLALDRPKDAFAVLESIHARSLAESIAKRCYNLILHLPAKFREQQLSLDDQRRIQENELQQAQQRHDPGREETIRQSLKKLEIEQRQWDADLGIALPRLAAIEYPHPIDVEAAKQSLPPGTLALAFAVNEKQTYLFALTRSSFHPYRLAVSRDQLIQKVSRARAICANINSTSRKYMPALKDLYQQLLGPAQQEISRAGSLLICPDGVLHSLPFAALMPREGRFLIQDHPLTVVGSLTIYRSLRSKRQIANPKVLAVGNPTYQMAAFTKPGVPPQPTVMGKTRQELKTTGVVAKEVGRLYAPHSLVLTQKQATIGNLLAKCANVDIVHIGCHGYADDRDPLNSWLALTPNANDVNGLLYVWQIMRMKTNARLVVLWACETGAGTDKRFEGVEGIARAFLTAGADNVLMSLWIVQDTPSAKLLLDFYQTWKNSQGKKTIADALREAQMRALKRDPRPYTWAPFVLNGAGQ